MSTFIDTYLRNIRILSRDSRDNRLVHSPDAASMGQYTTHPDQRNLSRCTAGTSKHTPKTKSIIMSRVIDANNLVHELDVIEHGSLLSGKAPETVSTMGRHQQRRSPRVPTIATQSIGLSRLQKRKASIILRTELVFNLETAKVADKCYIYFLGY